MIRLPWLFHECCSLPVSFLAQLIVQSCCRESNRAAVRDVWTCTHRQYRHFSENTVVLCDHFWNNCHISGTGESVVFFRPLFCLWIWQSGSLWLQHKQHFASRQNSGRCLLQPSFSVTFEWTEKLEKSFFARSSNFAYDVFITSASWLTKITRTTKLASCPACSTFADIRNHRRLS